MKFNYDCLYCNIKQVSKIQEVVEIDKETEEKIMREILSFLAKVSYDKTSPIVMQETWQIITRLMNNKNPYQSVKQEYNDLMLSLYDGLYTRLINEDNRFFKALNLAIEGNVIDYAASHSFSKEAIINKLVKKEVDALAIDHTKILYQQLKEASTLLYIGDNCGEIVLDKLLIEILKEEFPQINVVFSVRGQSILNDATKEDAAQVKMETVATVIDDGNGAPGTVLESVSQEFLEIFNGADVIIAKGQGNFEGLSSVKQKNLFLLFMAKCDLIAQEVKGKIMDKICLNNI
jgi:uncharacterized protein with ATP-grasp and redox domains